MLESHTKLCKLFIKFVKWDKCEKAENIRKQWANSVSLPWQKAFSEAYANTSFSACIWLCNKVKEHNPIIELDIHFDNDIFIKTLITKGYLEYIASTILLDKTYPWIEKLSNVLDNTSRRDKIINIIQQNHLLYKHTPHT